MPDKPRVFRPGPACSVPRARPRELRPTATQRGYDEAWRRLRAAVLAERPWCEVCGGPATDVHHRTPKRADQHACDVDPDGLASLCHPCHSRITARTRRHGRLPL